MIKNIFDQENTTEIIDRINQLQPDTKNLWGKMNGAQMLAHCNVTYEMIYEDKHPKAKGFKKFILKLLVKPLVIGEKKYKKNGPTATAFIISDERIFESEKNRLIDFITKTHVNGSDFFDGKESNSFGKLTSKEWNNMFYKHLDHHLSQFGL